VQASIDEAFDVFTAGMGSWWPRGGSHTILKAALLEVTIEPFVGGRWYHRGVDGSECDLGRVLSWEAPTRVVLGWQLNGRWQYVPDEVSEVEVRFESIPGDQVRVTLEHRALDVFKDTAPSLRAAIDSEGGWSQLLGLYQSRLADGHQAALRARA
jgi:uncharacterized protein YndB with AHSA1/START domain